MGIPQSDGAEKKETTKKQLNIAAHDLNNVMMAIAGSAELMLEATGEATRLRDLAERILRAARKGMTLVDTLKSMEDRVPSGSNRTPSNSSAAGSLPLPSTKKMPA